MTRRLLVVVVMLALSACSLINPTAEFRDRVDAAGVDSGDIDAGDVDSGGVDGGNVDSGGVDAGNDAGDPIVPCADRDIREMSLGRNHSCVRHACGTISCWGSGMDGQLGLGHRSSRLTPTMIPGVLDAVDLFAGGNTTCVVRTGGTVSCWGQNTGAGSGDSSDVPVDALGLTGIATLPIGAGRSVCAFGAGAGTMACWGENDRGQAGDGTMIPRLAPVMVMGLPGPVTQAAVDMRTCAVTDTNALYCWGDNAFGGLGDGGGPHQSVAVLVSGIPATDAVAVGSGHTCALDAANDLRCWGWNRWGQLGDGSLVDQMTASATSVVLGNVESVVTGGGHTCVQSTSALFSCLGRQLPRPTRHRQLRRREHTATGARLQRRSDRSGPRSHLHPQLRPRRSLFWRERQRTARRRHYRRPESVRGSHV